jgi:large subunit ribosomal protein L24
MNKIRKNDVVVVIAGRDKGKKGKVLNVQGDGKLVISGINMIKRHTKANPMQGTAGGIVEKEAPIQASNVAILNAATNKVDRVGFRILEDGKKVRIFKSNNEVVDS